MTVSRERLWSRIQHLHDFGQGPGGGVTRYSYSTAERAAKDCVGTWMREAGLQVREDAVGNLIGRLQGSVEDAPVVLVGSHLDSVPNGGDFDGPLGVLAAIEAIHALQSAGETPVNSIEVVAFTDEEGARFRFGMIGSRAIAGTFAATELERTDTDGVSIRAAMTTYGLDPERIREATRLPGSVRAYLELHIEQGKVLESAGEPVGVVSGIAGPLWLKLRVIGEAGHAGTTPMELRHDALVAAAAVIQMIEQETRRMSRTVGTVGQLGVQPGGVNIIPGQVDFSLDLRDVDESIRDTVEQRIIALAQGICDERGVALDVEVLQRVAPVDCDASIQKAMLAAASEIGLTLPALVSGAGHDGMQFADLWPVGMLFVRSKNGVSHHPDEYTTAQDCAVAADVLYRTVRRIAQV